MLSKNNFSASVNLLAVNTDPDVGLKAAQESEEQLRDAIKDSQIVIITAGFGGGTGTGASPFVAKIPRELGINCLAIVTLPFMSESKMRMDYALQGVEEIKQVAQAHITLSNDLLLKGIGENVGLFSGFNQSNEVLKNLLSALVQMLTQTCFINVDINDSSRIMSFEGQSILGVGRADSEDFALDSLAQALNNPLVSSADISSAQGIIIQVFCKKGNYCRYVR